MEDADVIQLIVRGIGRADVSIGALALVPDAGMLFPLAVVLAQRAGERVSRAELIELLWPGTDEAAGRHSLRQALYRLRRAGLRCEDADDDVCVEAASVDSDITAVLQPDWPSQAEAEAVERAASMLPGFAPTEGSALGEWCEQLRSRVALQYRRAVLHRIAMTRREGRWREVDHWALLLLAADPLNEEATLARAEAAAMAGAKAEALGILDSYIKELGDRAKIIGLPARMLRHRVSDLEDRAKRRIQPTSLPFVGRHEILGKLRDAIDQGLSGSPGTVWLCGPAGIGKTRVLAESGRFLRMGRALVAFGDARPSFESRPYALLTCLLEAMLQLPGALGAAPESLGLLSQVGRAAPPTEAASSSLPEVREANLFASWIDLVDALLSEQPLVIIVDDAQWSDADSLQMLARTLEARPTAQLAVVAASRVVPFGALAVGPHAIASIRIGPLSSEEIREYTEAAGLDSHPKYETTLQRLSVASGGHPLFLSHLLHQFREPRSLETLPVDLVSFVDSQLSLLSPLALRLLQACTLLARHSTPARLERVLGCTTPILLAPFAELDALLLLPVEAGSPLTPHDAWSERIRQSMLGGVLRAMSLSVARVLHEDAEEQAVSELYWDAARLFRLSGEPDTAYAAMMKCADYLGQSGAMLEADRAFSEAHALTENAVKRSAALIGRMRALKALAAWPELVDVIGHLEHLPTTPDSPSYGEIALTSIVARWQNTGTGFAWVDSLLPLVSNDTLPTHLRLEAAVFGMTIADNALDSAALRSVHDAASGVSPDSRIATMRKLQGEVVFHTVLGDLDTALATATALVGAGRDTGDDTNLRVCLNFAHYPPRRVGDFDLASARLLEAAEIALTRQNSGAAADCFDKLAGVCHEYGRLHEAMNFMDRCDSLFQPATGSHRHRSKCVTRSLILADLGQWPEARKLVYSPSEILADGRMRPHYLAVAARLRVACHFGEMDIAHFCVDSIDEARDYVFRHTGQDAVATAYAIGLEMCRDRATAEQFVEWYLWSHRRDRLAPPPTLSAFAAR